LLPLNSKITLYLPPPPCLDVCSSSWEILEIFNVSTVLRSSLNWWSILNDRLWTRR
jgi:hypothetical protein